MPYFRAFLTDSVAYVSSYAEPPDTQVRDLPVFRIESHAGSIYGALKRHFDELWDNESRPGTYLADHFMLEESAGGIVVWLDPEEESPFVALTQRSDGSWVLPKGHREISDESLEVTAIREIGEETGLAASSLRVVRSLDLYAAQETYADLGRPVHKVVHLYEVRCDAAEMPRMTPDADHAAARWWSLRDRLPPMHYEAQRIALSTYAEETYGIRTWF